MFKFWGRCIFILWSSVMSLFLSLFLSYFFPYFYPLVLAFRRIYGKTLLILLIWGGILKFLVYDQ